jgi:hypothetical protein
MSGIVDGFEGKRVEESTPDMSIRLRIGSS